MKQLKKYLSLLIDRIMRGRRIPRRADIINLSFGYMWDNEIEGDYLEFGCDQAHTFRLAVKYGRTLYPNTKYYAFDSFAGFPEIKGVDVCAGGGYKTGGMCTTLDEFHQILKKAGITKDQYICIEGFYENSLSTELYNSLKIKSAGIVNIDCDLYESTRHVLRWVKPYLRTGTIILFDDFFSYYADRKRGEQRALYEFLQENEDVHFIDWYCYETQGKAFFVNIDT